MREFSFRIPTVGRCHEYQFPAPLETFRRNRTELFHGLLLGSFHFGTRKTPSETVTAADRPARRADETKHFTPAPLPERVRKGFLPFDKDLSWKSGYRTSWARYFNCLATARSATRAVGA